MTNVLTCGTIPRMDPIAERIRRILQDKGWSERELSDKAGLSGVHVGKILDRGGDRTGASTIAKIARAAGVSVDWLITGEGSPYLSPRDLGERPVLGMLPGWPEAEAQVRAISPRIEEWVYQQARRVSAIAAPEHADAELVLKAVQLVKDYPPPPPGEHTPATQEALRRIAEVNARAEKALARKREGAGDVPQLPAPKPRKKHKRGG